MACSIRSGWLVNVAAAATLAVTGSLTGGAVAFASDADPARGRWVSSAGASAPTTTTKTASIPATLDGVIRSIPGFTATDAPEPAAGRETIATLADALSGFAVLYSAATIRPDERATMPENLPGDEWRAYASDFDSLANSGARVDGKLARQVAALTAAMREVADCWDTDAVEFLVEYGKDLPEHIGVNVDARQVCGSPESHPDAGTSAWADFDQAVARLGIRCELADNDLACGVKSPRVPRGVPNMVWVGDCFPDDSSGDFVVDCDAPHDAEVVSTHLHPIEKVRAASAGKQCSADFRDYVGIHVSESTLRGFFFPAGESLSSGFVCIATNGNGKPLKGSVKGASARVRAGS
jgi:hypothetical protein